MSATGYLQVRAYTSYAQLPLKDVAITITDTSGTAIAMRVTDRNGLIQTVAISVPDRAESLSPAPDEIPYSVVNLYAYKNGFEQVEAKNLQIFAGTTTYQNLVMVPLSELPELNQTIIYQTPPQNL